MAQININLSKIEYNADALRTLLENNDIHLTPVIKCIAGDSRIIETLIQSGFTHFAESRLENINEDFKGQCNYLLLRPTSKNRYTQLIKSVKMSMQTEIESIREINDIAKQLNQKHQIMLMIDWKDRREGVITYDVLNYIEEIIKMTHIQLIGIAFNFMCFKSSAPTEEDILKINQFVDAIEYNLGFRLKVVSGGNSSMIPQLMYNDLGRINELRIGEALFRGIDTTTNQSIPMLFQNAITVEAEILEIKPRLSDNNQCYLQAIVDIGYVDTDVNKIKPIKNDVSIVGASSDHLMINLNNQDYYKVGDIIEFAMEYEALSQVMYHNHMTKHYFKDNYIQSLNSMMVDSPLLINKNVNQFFVGINYHINFNKLISL